MDFKDPAVLAALSAVTSIVTTLAIKPWIDNKFHKLKLDVEFKSEQRKKIKQVLAKYKVHLIKVCDEVNHRFWNFQENYSQNWHCVKNEDYDKPNYYFKSFVYRIMAVFAWIKIIEEELIYLDTTIASKEELNLLKYFRLFKEIFTSVQIFKGLPYNQSHAIDHFFRNKFEEMTELFIKDNKVIPFSEFNNNFHSLLPSIEPICAFLNGINPDEKRLRWDRFHLFHIVLIGFVNSYGYDFQQVDEETILKINTRIGKNKLLNNLQEHIAYYKLDKEKELMSVITTLR